jgi:hypothetical protein
MALGHTAAAWDSPGFSASRRAENHRLRISESWLLPFLECDRQTSTPASLLRAVRTPSNDAARRTSRRTTGISSRLMPSTNTAGTTRATPGTTAAKAKSDQRDRCSTSPRATQVRAEPLKTLQARAPPVTLERFPTA